MTGEIYLDAQGTERPRPEAVDAIVTCLGEGFGNAGATAHARGRRALAKVESARVVIANALNADPDGVVFCSGATEANNLALRSFVRPEGVLIASAVEHKSVLAPGSELGIEGRWFETCEVDSSGLVDLDSLRARLGRPGTVVSVMHANNEVGTIQPIAQVAAICRAAGAILHVDAAQTVGKLHVDFAALGADVITVSGHKFGGPVGSGALVFRPEHVDRIRPLIVGGGQEAGLRGGTVPVALVAGMSAALAAATRDLDRDLAAITSLRDDLIKGIRDLPGFFMNGDPERRLGCNFSGGFEHVEAGLLMRRVPELHFAAGSACTTGHAANHVLQAIGLAPRRRRATVRISLSWATQRCEIDYLVGRLRDVVLSIHRAEAA